MGFRCGLGVDDAVGLRRGHAFLLAAVCGLSGRGVKEFLTIKGERVVAGGGDQDAVLAFVQVVSVDGRMLAGKGSGEAGDGRG